MCKDETIVRHISLNSTVCAVTPMLDWYTDFSDSHVNLCKLEHDLVHITSSLAGKDHDPAHILIQVIDITK